MKEKSIKVNGVNMRWLEKGKGPVIILIHGIPTTPELWRNVMPALTNKRRIAWEMIGYGASVEEGRSRDISIGAQAGYLASWLEAMNMKKVVLAGHDLGGGVAQIIAALRPEIVQGLVLINSISYDSWPIPRVKALRALGPLSARLPNAALRIAMQALLYEGHATKERAEDSLNHYWKHYEHLNAAEALRRQIQHLDVKDTLAVTDKLREVNIPARIVWGESDHFQTIDYAERLAKDLNAPLDRIEGGKHFVPVDYPRHVVYAIEEVMKDPAFTENKP